MIEIRRATKEELIIIQHIGYKAYWATYHKILGDKQVEYMLEKFYNLKALKEQVEKGLIFLLCKNNHKDLAFASYSLNNANSKIYHLQKLYVLPEAQGKGLGKLLIKTVIENCKTKGGQLLQLNVNRYNDARKFYEKIGFVAKNSVDIPIGGGYFMNDYIMELDISF